MTRPELNFASEPVPEPNMKSGTGTVTGGSVTGGVHVIQPGNWRGARDAGNSLVQNRENL